jgi:N-acetylmuramoyl-L-alanine amidase
MYTQKGICHLFKIPMANARMAPIDANGRETLEQIYKRLPEPKPDLLFNGSMFDYKGGWPTGAVKIDGKNIQPNMGVMKHLLGFRGRDVLIEAHKTGAFTTVTKDMDSALESYPLLLPTLDSSGLNPALVNNAHPRTSVGTSDGFIHLLFTDGRYVSAGITSQQAQKELKDHGATRAIGLDGGSSTKLLAFGVRVNNQSENSPIINAVGIWFDDLPILNDTLKRGSKGFPVMLLQKHLGITIDGSFGPMTENAVKAFQSKNGLTSDGIAGPKTWGALKPKPVSDSKEPYSDNKTFKFVIGAGHGPETPGKRSPDSTGLLREFHFNLAVANKVVALLSEFEDVEVLTTHELDRDVPLNERIQKVIDRGGATAYVDIHANAFGSTWNTAGGIETYVTTNRDTPSVNLAGSVQNELLKATGLRDRGVKEADFRILWGSPHNWQEYQRLVPARILVECGFMTNREEARLLLSEAYRYLCAGAIVKGLAQTYSLKKKESLPQIRQTTRVTYKGKTLNAWITDQSKSVTETRGLAELVGLNVIWNSKTQTIELYDN